MCPLHSLMAKYWRVSDGAGWLWGPSVSSGMSPRVTWNPRQAPVEQSQCSEVCSHAHQCVQWEGGVWYNLPKGPFWSPSAAESPSTCRKQLLMAECR